MQSKYYLSLTSGNQFKTQAIIDVITKLEKLNTIKSELLYNINTKISERINRLQGIKSRLVRLKEMIKIVSVQKTTITIKSMMNYPKKKIKFPNMALGSDELDINLLRLANAMGFNDQINTKNPYCEADNNPATTGQPSTYLKEAPSGDINSALNIQFVMNQALNRYNEISKIIFDEKINSSLGDDSLFQIDQNDLNSLYTNTNFSVINKKKFNAQIQKIIEGEFVKAEETEQMKAFDKKMKEREKSKNLQQAPVSILTNQKIDEYRDKIVVNLNKNEQNFDIDLPADLNLGNVAEIERDQEAEVDKLEDNNSDQAEKEIIQKEIDDIFQNREEAEVPEEEGPLDWMEERRNRTVVTKDAQLTSSPTEQYPSTNVPSTTTDVPATSGFPEIPSVPSIPDIPAPSTSTKKVSPPPVRPTPISPVPISAPSIPSIPDISIPPSEAPATESNAGGEVSQEDELLAAMKKLKKVGEVSVEDAKPKELSMEEMIMQARKKIKNKPNEPKKESNEGEAEENKPEEDNKQGPSETKEVQEEEINPNTEVQNAEEPSNAAPGEKKEMTMEEELQAAMKGLKKVGQQKVKEEPPKEMTMEQQIYAARNKLKKTGDVQAQKKPVDQPQKNLSLMEILQKQIKNRFDNIHQHEESDEEDDSGDEEEF